MQLQSQAAFDLLQLAKDGAKTLPLQDIMQNFLCCSSAGFTTGNTLQEDGRAVESMEPIAMLPNLEEGMCGWDFESMRGKGVPVA